MANFSAIGRRIHAALVNPRAYTFSFFAAFRRSVRSAAERAIHSSSVPPYLFYRQLLSSQFSFLLLLDQICGFTIISQIGLYITFIENAKSPAHSVHKVSTAKRPTKTPNTRPNRKSTFGTAATAQSADADRSRLNSITYT